MIHSRCFSHSASTGGPQKDPRKTPTSSDGTGERGTKMPLNMTTEEVDAVLADVKDRGLARTDREDIICAAQYVDDPRDLIALLKSWDDDYRIEQECDDKASAWFEEASYGRD